MTNSTLAVDRLNHSSALRLLRNPLIFKMKDILNYYDYPMSMNMAVGSACHKAIETQEGGNPEVPVPNDRDKAREIGIETGLQWLKDRASTVEYGKTGSPEKMYRLYSQAIGFYYAEVPEYHEVLSVEEKFSSKLTTLDGHEFPLPASGMADLVVRNEQGEIEIIDNKFVTSFSSPDEEDPTKIVQAMFLFYLVRAVYNEMPVRCIFRQVKTSLNSREKAGEPQMQDYVIPYDHKPYHVVFYNLYNDIVRFLKGEMVYLPNITDQMTGKDAWLMYSQGLISGDMSDVEVMHKVKDVAFATKRFIINPLDRAENEDLPVEERIVMAMNNVGVPLEYVEQKEGGPITQYRFKVTAGVRMANVKKHVADIQAAVRSAGDITVHAPVKGTNLVGVDVENAHRPVYKVKKSYLKEGTLSIPVGIDINGEPIVDDLSEMPHLLIGGATGSGKSETLHTVLNSIIAQNTPEQLQLVLIDPKRVELKGIANKNKQYVRGSVLYEWPEILNSLVQLTGEMESRYKILENAGKRDIKEFNASKRKEILKLPYIVAVIDEFADVILRSSAEESKNKTRSYYSRTKQWLLKELMRRAGPSGDLWIPSENDPEELVKARFNGKMDKDSLAELLEVHDTLDATKGAEVETLIVRLAAMARAVGIHLVIATQRPSVDVITGLIKANFPTRIALTCSSPADSKVILGTTGAEKLSGKGDMLYQNPNRRGQLRLQGFKGFEAK